MQQTAVLALGASRSAIDLPDGGPIGAVRVDNPGGYWYQVYPGGGIVPPYTAGTVIPFDADAPSVGLTALPTYNDAPSVASGSGPTVTVYSPDEAPGLSASTGIQPVGSSLRFVGTLRHAQNLAVDLTANERSIVVLVPADAASATEIVIEAIVGGVPLVFRDSYFPATASTVPGIVVAPVNPAVATTWQVVSAIGALVDPVVSYVFASSDSGAVSIASDQYQPVFAQIVNNGPFSGGGAVTPLYVQSVHGGTDLIGQQAAAGSLPVVPPSDLPIGTTGQKAMAASLPVVMASDQSALPIARNTYDNVLRAYLAVAVTVARSVTAIVTPGAGQAIQLLGAHMGIDRTATGIVDIFVCDAASVPYAMAEGLSVGGTTWFDVVIPPGGVKLPVGSAVSLSQSGSVATGVAQAIIYYKVI